LGLLKKEKMVKFSPALRKNSVQKRLENKTFFLSVGVYRKDFKLFSNVRKVRKNKKASCCDEKW